MTEKKRYYNLIDAIRGFAVIHMVLFHFLYDVNIVFGKNSGWYRLPLVHVWQQFICITFIFISGISFHFSKNNTKRGLLINLYGLGITLVTVISMPSEAVWFGILNFIGCAILLLLLTKKWMAKIPCVCGFLCSLLLFLLFRNVQDGYLGLERFALLPLPSFLYEMKIFTILGFPYPGFSSSDFFPLLPWYFLYTAGYFFWAFMLKLQKDSLFAPKIPLLSAIGTKSIWIYLIHQPAAMLICYLLYR